MKAARLNKPGALLDIEDLPDGRGILPGAVKVRVEQALVPSFTAAVLSGNMPFPLPVPYTPGPSCVGTVEAVGEGVYGFTLGQRVLCGPHHTSRVNGGSQEEILVGWFPLTPGAGPLMDRWKDGAFAEQAQYPANCVTLLDNRDPAELIRLAPLCIAYGGLQRGEFRAGQSLLVNGATGNLGSASVLVALAMGAARVYAVGRNATVLEELQSLDARRVVPVQVTGEVEVYAEQVAKQASRVDVVLDCLGYVADPAPVMACLAQLRPKGVAVFMGGVLTDIPVSYLQMLAMQLTIRGSFMHPPSAASELLALVQAGQLDLGKLRTRAFPLCDANKAIQQASEYRGLSCCTLKP